MESLRELFISLGLEADEAAFATAQAAVDGLEKAAELAVEALKKMGEFFVDAVMETTEYGSKIHDTAIAAGVGVDALQELGFAAKLSGSSMEELAHSLGILSRNMGEAKSGSKEAQAAFASLGIKVTDSSGHLRDADDVFTDVADALLKLPPGSERTAKAFTVLGRGAQALMPLLAEGSAGIEAMREQARELGLVMDDEAVNAADNFGDSLDTLRGIAASVKGVIGTQLIQALQPAVDLMIAWWRANRALVTQNITRFVAGLITVARAFAKAIEWVVDNIDLLIAAVKTIGIIIGTYFVAQLLLASGTLLGMLVSFALNTAAAILYAATSVSAAASAATAWLSASAPLLLINALLALLVLAAEDVWTALQGGDSLIGSLGPKWTKFIDDWLKPQAGDNWFIAALKKIVGYLTDIEGRLLPDLKKAWDALGASATPIGFAIRLANQKAQNPDQPLDVGEALFPSRGSPTATATAEAQKAPAILAPQFNGTFNVTAAPGQSTEQVAGSVREQLDDWWHTKLGPVLPVVR